MSDDDKFGFCGLVWLLSMALVSHVFKELSLHVWFGIILSFIISTAIFICIYSKWTEN